MRLGDLPVELFEAILAASVRQRGMKRGLRLRLVNKIFAEHVIRVLYAFNLLDEYFATSPPPEKRHFPPFLPSYLQFRISNEPDNGNCAMIHIRSIATQLHRDESRPMSLNSVQDIVAVLCESCFDETRDSSSTLRSVLSGDLWQDEENFSQDLFVAAIRINAVATVQSMLNDGHDRFNPSKLFGRPVTIAAAHGHFEIIKLLLWTPPSQGLHFEFRCHAFERAARAGHLDTVKSIYDLICTVDPWIFWKMEGRPLPRYHLVHELRTPSIDVWNFMVELRKKHLADKWDEWLHRDKLTHLFRYAIYCGWKEMACYLLTLGAWPDGRSDDQFYKRPIYEVCKNGHFDITKSLLGHGAKTEGTIKIAARRGHYEIVRVLLEHGAETKGGLAAAAEGGYTCIARMLLDHGVDVNEDSPRPISSAIDLENSSMLALFLQRGAEVSADLRDAISRYEGVLPLLGHHQC